jgi:hypothetical protein
VYVVIILGLVCIDPMHLRAQGQRPAQLVLAQPTSKATARAATLARDVRLPGTQPGTLHDMILDPATCVSCHTPPIYERWRGSMMSQAARDPVMWAVLTIANQDAPDVGDFCLRCHVPSGWLAGRSSPADGTALRALDLRAGVACEVCHRLVDPVPSATDSAAELDVTIRTQLELSGTLPPETIVGNAMLILDPNDNRRGPFALPITPPHPLDTYQTDLFDQAGDAVARSRVCGNCHNVSNPTLSWTEEPPGDAPAQFWPNDADTPPPALGPSQSPGGLFPIERTFDEWRASDYAQPGGVVAAQFAGAQPNGRVGACPDCHLPRMTGKAVTLSTGVQRDCVTTGCLPEHELVGGNAWVPLLLQDTRWRLNSAADATFLDVTAARAQAMLARAATLTATLSSSTAGPQITVRITNETGHKLPTGYPEGRRIWLNVKAFDAAEHLVYESGAYDALTGILADDPAPKVYEAKLGITPEFAAQLGLPAGESFHFVLNNTYLKDNRIPPRGYTVAAFDQPGLRPVGATYSDEQFWDETLYTLPASAKSAQVTLYYQTASKEYIDFLRANGGDDGATLGQLWDDLKSPPVEMTTLSLELPQSSLLLPFVAP